MPSEARPETMTPSRERPALAVLAWLWSAACWAALAEAQTPATPKTSSDAPIPFDIPAQPMAAALNSWAVQANAQIFVDPGPVARLTAPAVKGTLRPRQALRALLAHSNLEITQGSSGVFVIKPRAAVAATPPATLSVPQAAPAERPAPASPPQIMSTRATQGPWRVGLFADFASDHGSANGGGAPALHGEYLLTDNLAAALQVAAPRTHSFDVPGSVATARASAQLLSSAVGLKYYFLPEQRWDPYLAGGINVTTLYGATGVTALDRVSVGPMVEAGLDVSLSQHWKLDADVGWTQIRPKDGSGQQIHLDPVEFDLGFVYRF